MQQRLLRRKSGTIKKWLMKEQKRRWTVQLQPRETRMLELERWNEEKSAKSESCKSFREAGAGRPKRANERHFLPSAGLDVRGARDVQRPVFPKPA